MSKKKKTNESEPPSLFDNLDLFAPMTKADEKSGEKGESKEAPPEKKSEPAKKESAPPPPRRAAQVFRGSPPPLRAAGISGRAGSSPR
jgi:hypothetical protein